MRREGVLLDDFLVQQVQALHATHPDAVDSGFYLDLLEYHTTALGTAEIRTRDDLRMRYPYRVAELEPVLNRLKELYLLIEAPEAAVGFVVEGEPPVGVEYRHAGGKLI